MTIRNLFSAISFVIMMLGLRFAYSEWKAAAAMQPPAKSPEYAPLSHASIRDAAAIASKDPAAPLVDARDVPVAPPANASVAFKPSAAAVERWARLAPTLMTEEDAITTVFSKDPAFAASYLRAYRAGAAQEYWDVLRQQGATDGQIREFVEIMAKWKEAWAEIRATAIAKGQPTPSADLTAFDQGNLEARNTALRALLGPGTPDLLNAHENTNRGRVFVADVAAPAFSMGDPLSHAQTQQLVQLIAASNIEVRRDRGTWIYPTEADYDYVLSRASAFLTPNQLVLTRERLAKQRDTAERILMARGK